MIEVTLTEALLFAWAVGATAAWMQTRDDLRAAKLMLRAMIEDEDVRTKVLKSFEQFKQENRT